jgi:integrase
MAINQTAAGKWVVDRWFFDEGKRKRKERTFAKKKEATAFYESTRSKVRDNEYTPPSKHSVKEMAERYLEAMKPKVKVQTYLQYKCHVDKYIVPKFGVAYNPMTRVDRQRDNKTLEAIEAEAIRGLTQVDDDGAGDGHLRAVGPREVYSGEEVKKLIDASKPGLERAFHMTAVMTGMRHGELDGLQWDRVDFDKSRIFISRSLTELKGGAIIERPKSRAAYRYLPMTPMLASELKRWKLQSPINEMDLVFTDPLGRGLNRKSNNRRLKQAGKRQRLRR